jgi:drug/metabolite transporter (DMT)-like permease
MKMGGALLPSAMIVLSSALWGSMWIPLHVVRDAGVAGTWLAFLVYGIPAFFLAPWSFRAGPRRLLRHWRLLAPIGFFTGLCNVLYVIGVSYGDVAMVILLFYVNPVWSALLERLALKTAITRWRMGAIVLGMAGMWVLIAGDGTLATHAGGVELVGLLAGFAWAAALVLMRVSGDVDHLDKAFSQYFFALLIGGAIIALGVFPASSAWADISWSFVLPWILAIGIVWVLPGLLLSFWGAARISPTRASMLFMSEVIVGVGSAALLGESQLTWRHAVGGAMIIAAGFLDGLTDEKAKAKT